ncbi:hypothetical protein TeGR_g7155, partial [Tetraparma gracilis]
MSASLHTQSSSTVYSYDRTLSLPSSDHQDHTFCGVSFSIATKPDAPCTQLQITSLSVRGALGRVSIYTTKQLIPHTDVYSDPSAWYRVHLSDNAASFRSYKALPFDEPVDLPPGCARGFYVHSEMQNDQAIVYDNVRSHTPSADVHVSVLPGLAHLSPTPFSSHGGFAWGGWRRNRVFVGKVDYGVKTVLWTKKNHLLFTKSFRVCASA